MKVTLRNVRIAFPHIFEPTTVNGEGEPACSAAFLFPPGHQAEKDLRAACETVGREKWGAKWPAIKTSIEESGKALVKKGDAKAELVGYAGNLFINARNKQRPTVIDRNKSPLTEADGRIYAGCRVNALVELWAQENQYGKRINASLRGIQFHDDDDRFSGGGVASVDEFDDYGEAEATDLA